MHEDVILKRMTPKIVRDLSDFRVDLTLVLLNRQPAPGSFVGFWKEGSLKRMGTLPLYKGLKPGKYYVSW